MNAKVKRKPKNSGGQWRQKLLYGWQNVFQDLLRQPLASLLVIMVISISLTLPAICYLLWKNADQAAAQWYPLPQLTVYLDKALDDKAASGVVESLQKLPAVDKVNYLSREEAAGEFRNWSGFGGALDMLEENPLPAVAIVTPKMGYTRESLQQLHDRLANTSGVDEVRLDDSWSDRLAALTDLVAQVAVAIGLLMMVAVFLVIGNSIRLTIFSRRKVIRVMKLIGATDGFVLRPLLNEGALLGFVGAILALIVAELLIWWLEKLVLQVTQVFGTVFHLSGFSWDESIILLVVATMIGWMAAWLTAVRGLRAEPAAD